MDIDEHFVCCGMDIFHSEQILTMKVAKWMVDVISSDRSSWADSFYYDDPQPPYSKVYEAILPDYMLSHEESYEALKKLMDFGFKLVTRFKNSNTGNFVNIYHYKSHRSVGDGQDPLDYAKQWAKK